MKHASGKSRGKFQPAEDAKGKCEGMGRARLVDVEEGGKEGKAWGGVVRFVGYSFARLGDFRSDGSLLDAFSLLGTE